MMTINKPGVEPVEINANGTVECGQDDVDPPNGEFLPWNEESREDGPHFKAKRTRPIGSSGYQLVWLVDHDSTSGTVVINDKLSLEKIPSGE